MLKSRLSAAERRVLNYLGADPRYCNRFLTPEKVVELAEYARSPELFQAVKSLELRGMIRLRKVHAQDYDAYRITQRGRKVLGAS